MEQKGWFFPSDLATWANGSWQGKVPLSFDAISTDTRSINHGDLFLAIRGTNFDGHAFCQKALESGATAVVANRSAAIPSDIPALLVEDTTHALCDIAKGWRRKVDPFIVGVTGSVGKTTVKELTAHLLGVLGSVAKTCGNWNNSFGLPKSLLSMAPTARYGVFETGTNHPGEIAPLASLLEPDAAVLSNIGPVHIGNFGTEERIANEKADLLRAVPPTGFVVLDASGRHFDFLSCQVHCRVVTVSPVPSIVARYVLHSSSPATGEFSLLDTADGSLHNLIAPLPGEHQITDSLLAIAVARELGVDWDQIVARLPQARGEHGRWELIQAGGIEFINDAYNANPVSMVKALNTFSTIKTAGRKIAVLGDMFELGEGEAAFHTQVGGAAATAGLDALVAVGQKSTKWLSKGALAAGMPSSRIHTLPTTAAAKDFLRDFLVPGDTVLLKASHSMALDQLVRCYEISQ